METIVIKLLENPDNPQLKLKYVGAMEYALPKSGPDGKVITGLDENALSILSIEDTVLRASTVKSIKKEREDLERLLGRDLGPNSDFWDDFFVILSDEEITLDPQNPLDRLKERFLVANRYVAPSQEAIDSEDEYQNCIFYMHRKSEDIDKKAKKQMALDEVKYKLYSLKENNESVLKQIYSYIYGYDASDIKANEAYLKLSQGFEDLDPKIAKRNVAAFMEAASKTPEQLATKVILDKAVKKKIVTVRNRIYRRGEVIFGNTYEEAIEFLSSVDNQSELKSLMKEVK